MWYAHSIQWTYDLVKEYIENLGYIMVSDNYINARTKFSISDKLGYYYSITLTNFKKVKPPIVHKFNPYTIQNIKLWCELNNKTFELLSTDYIGTKVELEWKCFVCNEVFKASWDEIGKCGCGVCAGRQAALSNCLATKNTELAKEWHPTLNGEITPYDVTYGSNIKVWWQCSKNINHVWEASVVNRNNGNGCIYCASKKPSYDNNLLSNNPKLCEEWNYEKNDRTPEEFMPQSSKKVWWKCGECGNEWQAIIGHRNSRGDSCPKCNKSKGEIRISLYLKNNSLIFIPQKEFNGLNGIYGGNLSYDFYLPDINTIIEYQGIQHEQFVKCFHRDKKGFEKQLEHDKRKKEYAQNNNIKFLEIWYYDYDNIEEILDKYLQNN